MIRYNLPPSLCSHYNRFFATTGQSAPTWYFGFEPLGCSHCAHPLALPCRFPSSVIKPEYSSCPLKDASRIANNSGSRYTYNSVSYSVAFDWVYNFSTPHQGFTLVQLLYPYLHYLMDSLFLNAQHHSSLPQHL